MASVARAAITASRSGAANAKSTTRSLATRADLLAGHGCVLLPEDALLWFELIICLRQFELAKKSC